MVLMLSDNFAARLYCSPKCQGSQKVNSYAGLQICAMRQTHSLQKGIIAGLLYVMLLLAFSVSKKTFDARSWAVELIHSFHLRYIQTPATMPLKE